MSFCKMDTTKGDLYMNNKTVLAAALLVLAISGVWYVRSTAPKPVTEQMQQEPTTTATNSASSDTQTGNANAMTITVEGSEMKFLPATLTFTAGQQVKLVFKNTGNMPHDFVIDELGVRTKQIGKGTSETVEFTPTKTGTFEYYCSVGFHRKLGMKGTVTVK